MFAFVVWLFFTSGSLLSLPTGGWSVGLDTALAVLLLILVRPWFMGVSVSDNEVVVRSWFWTYHLPVSEIVEITWRPYTA